MAVTKSNVGNFSQIVYRIDDIHDDFPERGITISDRSAVYIDNGSSADVVMEVTFDSQTYVREDEQDEDKLRWSEYKTVSAGNQEMITFDPGPSAIKLKAEETGAFAWIRT